MTDDLNDLLSDMDREATSPRETPGVDRSKWGLFPNVTFAEYMLDPAPEPSISNSGISLLLNETPLDFAFDHPRLPPVDAEKLRNDTLANILGSVTHRLALGKGAEYAVGDYDAWRSTEAKAFKLAAEKEGRCAIIRDKFNECLVMADILKERIKRALDGASYETEVVFLYQEETPFGPVWVRGMLDVWCEERAMILDPKITPRIYDGLVDRQFVNMGWDRQAALYPYAVGKIFPELAGRVQFADLLVKPKPPYPSRLVTPEKAWCAMKLRECLKTIETFAYCLKENRWPGFPENEVDIIHMPRWEEARLTEEEIYNAASDD